jgi:hypothetical protein
LKESLVKVSTKAELEVVRETFEAISESIEKSDGDVNEEPDKEPSDESNEESKAATTKSTKAATTKSTKAATTKSTKPKIDPIENFEGFLESDKDAQEYLALCTITGKIIVPAQMGEYEIKSWIADLHEWVSQGKPKAKMPKVKRGLLKFATALYRIRDQGRDKLYGYLNDGTTMGVKEIIEYEQVENITTGDLEDSKVIKNKFNSYTEEFTSVQCKKLIKEADALMRPGQSLQLYFWFNGAKKPISPENMMLSYEKLADMIRERKPLN